MARRSYEARAFIGATPAQVFDFLDDHLRLVSHMSQSSWSMGGGRMTLAADAGQGRVVGSRLRLTGRAFGIHLEVEEEIVEREPPLRKTWRTIGEPRLLIIGQYKLGFQLAPAVNGTQTRIFIDYELPTGSLTRWAGLALAGAYARWCVDRMIGDTARHYTESTLASSKAA
jgi:hypothetical protein